MSEINSELASRLVKGRKRDGRCTYDADAKAEIVQACLRPGVSVARIGMLYGINANLLRAWIGKRNAAVARRPALSTAPVDAGAAFVPLQVQLSKPASLRLPVPPTASPSAAQAAAPAPELLALHVRLPNGVALDLSQARAGELATVIELLSGLPCSPSTAR